VGTKDLQMVSVGGRTLMDSYGDLFCILLYGCLWLPATLEMLLARPSIGKAPWLMIGLLGAVGSVVGLVFSCMAAKGVAAVIFPVGAVTGILVTSGLSVVLFRERVTRGLYVCVALAIVAVLAGSVGSAIGL
jgi:drug/metabolite transporter (DMT)-like permease